METSVIYSVYNYQTKLYDYYEHAIPGTAHAPKPPSATPIKAGMGAVPDRAAWPLPSGARHVGRGQLPKGRIATQGAIRGMGFGDFDSATNLLAIGGLAYLGWKFFKKR